MHCIWTKHNSMKHLTVLTQIRRHGHPHAMLWIKHRRKGKERKEKKKEKEKTTSFGVNLMRSQVSYRAAQGSSTEAGWWQWHTSLTCTWSCACTCGACKPGWGCCRFGWLLDAGLLSSAGILSSAGLPATLGPAGMFASSFTVSLHRQGKIRRPTAETKLKKP